MYRDDSEAAARRVAALERAIEDTQAPDDADALRARVTALDEELARVRASLRTGGERAAEMERTVGWLRRVLGMPGEDIPRLGTMRRAIVGFALTAVLVAGLIGVLLGSLSVMGNALRIFVRGDGSARAAPALPPPPPFSERDLPGFPRNVDVDAALRAVVSEHPGARLARLEVNGVAVDGFVDLTADVTNGVTLVLAEPRDRMTLVTLDDRGLTSRTGPAEPGLLAADSPYCSVRLLWDWAQVLAGSDIAAGTLAVVRFAPARPAPWMVELETGESVWLDATCQPYVAPPLPLDAGEHVTLPCCDE